MNLPPPSLLPGTVERLFRAEAGALGDVLAFVEATATALALPPALMVKLLLVVEELFLNTVHHGGEQAAAAPVRLSLQRGAAVVHLHYDDAAPAYDPFAAVDMQAHAGSLAERPVGQLGVVLVQGFAREACYQRQDGRNCLHLELECPA